jgi:hypothetical protein
MSAKQLSRFTVTDIEKDIVFLGEAASDEAG